jgi:hypothetical protein
MDQFRSRRDVGIELPDRSHDTSQSNIPSSFVLALWKVVLLLLEIDTGCKKTMFDEFSEEPCHITADRKIEDNTGTSFQRAKTVLAKAGFAIKHEEARADQAALGQVPDPNQISRLLSTRASILHPQRDSGVPSERNQIRCNGLQE